jgi:CHAT domain-containing protein/tetratricopeptide (TPR) repeat protein
MARPSLNRRAILTVAATVLLACLTAAGAHAQSAKPREPTKLRQQQAFELYQKGKSAEALPLALRAVADIEGAKGPHHPELGDALNTLGLIEWSLARYGDAEQTYKRAIAIAEHNGTRDWTLGARLNNLAIVYSAQARYDEAEQTYKRAMVIADNVFSPSHTELARVLTNMTNVFKAQGRLSEAQAAAERALRIREAAHGPNHIDVGHSLFTLSEVYRLQDRKADAEPLVKRALVIEDAVSGPNHPNMISRLNNLAEAYRSEGRFDEAEPLYRRALAIAEQVSNDHFVMSVSNNLGWVYWADGRQDEAERALKRAVALAERVLGPAHPTLLTMLHNLAAVYRVQSRPAEAEATIRRALSIGEQTGNRHLHIAKALNNLGLLLQDQGRPVEAKSTFERAIEQVGWTLGPEHLDVATVSGNLGALHAHRGEWPQAATALRRAAEITSNRSRRLPSKLGRPLASTTAGEATRPSERHALLLKVLDRVASLPGGDRDRIEADMFAAAQLVRGSQAAVSLGQMAARQAKGDGVLAKLIRERQDLVGEWQARDKLLIAAVARAPEARIASAESLLRERLAVIDHRLVEIDGMLATSFPEYVSFLSAEPLSIPQVQALLRSNEAMVVAIDTAAAMPMPEETFVWVVTKLESRRVRTNLGSAALHREVAALRCGLDQSAWRQQVGPLACSTLLGISADKSASDPLPFDLERAHALYRSLLADVEDLIQGRQLLIVPSGPMHALPWQVLVAQPPTSKSDYARAAWLGTRHAMTVLPAVSSLAALRGQTRSTHAEEPYVGFGNPLLTGITGTDRSAFGRQSCPEPTVSRPVLVASADRQRALPAFIRGGHVDVEDLRRQPPLPETADELCRVARSQNIQRPDEVVHLGGNATETRIKAMSRDGALARAGIVHIATHGLLPSETASLAGMREAALMLTPPVEPTGEDDGLLTASEVATLKLNADWVILSACNTAGAGDSGSDALSGLARAFFYAGARALLVSHWYVDSDATVNLITKVFETIRQDPTIGRAEAMRDAMARMIAGGGRGQHPASWAPFVVVGEGAAAR